MSSIAILGPGRQGTAIGQLFASHGVDVILYHRDPAKADRARAAIAGVARGAAVRTVADLPAAADAAEVLALTTLWGDAQRSVIGGLGDALIGKTLIDVSNPLDVVGGRIIPRRPAEGSAGGFVATLLPTGAGHVKAFSNLATDFINDGADHTPPAVLPFLADSAQTADAVRPLLARTGWQPWLAGGIDRSADLEIGGSMNQIQGRYGRARLDAAEFAAHFGPEITPAATTNGTTR